MNKKEALKQFKSGWKAWPYFKNGKDSSNGIYFSFDPKENAIKERTIKALETDGKIKSVQVFTIDQASVDQVVDVRYYYVLASADVPDIVEFKIHELRRCEAVQKTKMNFQAQQLTWIGDDAYSISETVDFGAHEIYGLTVRLSGYACRTQTRFGAELRFFGNYQIYRAGDILSDQRGLDIASFPELLDWATRSVLLHSGQPMKEESWGAR